MIDGVSAAPTTVENPNGLGSLGSDVFLQLLVAQLRYQNPMEPADATTMMQQTSQFTMVETLQGIADTQQQLINMSELAAGLDMVGKEVEAIGFDGSLVEGLVEGVRFAPEGIILEMGDVEVPLINVISVDLASSSDGGDGGGGDPTV